jgi:protein-tyrosine phosphatase
MGSGALPMSSEKKKVLFVCMGNICRSPVLMAELQRQAKERKLENQVFVDSCALTAWHIGENTDLRMQKAALSRGLKVQHKAKLFEKEYFKTFDLIFAVDRDVLHLLLQAAKDAHPTAKVALATAYSKTYKDQDIQDPYYDVESAFDRTMLMAEECCRGILDMLFTKG